MVHDEVKDFVVRLKAARRNGARNFTLEVNHLAQHVTVFYHTKLGRKHGYSLALPSDEAQEIIARITRHIDYLNVE